jgi:hypothetical protein
MMNWDDLAPEEREELCGVPHPKVTVCARPEYTIQYEQVGRHTFIHVIVVRWSPSIKDRFARDCDTLQGLLDGPVLVLCNNRKLCKFCLMFGFEHWADVATDGKTVILIRNNKKHGQQPIRWWHDKD